MLLVGAFLSIGLMLGFGFRGTLRDLAGKRIGLWWLAPVAAALQVVPSPEGDGIARLLPLVGLLLSFVLLLVVAGANWRLPGFALILVGVALNFTVIAANRGMPVSAAAVETLGEDPARLRDAPLGARHHLASREDVLRPIGDVIPFGEPFEVIVSPGDVLMYSGAAAYLALAMTGHPRRGRAPRLPRDRPAPSS